MRRAPLAAGAAAMSALLLFPSPRASAAPGRSERVWVTNERSRTVTVVDPARAEAVATIDVGGRARGIQPSPDGRTLYVAVSAREGVGENAIVCIDAEKGRVSRRLPSGPDPEQLAVTPDGRTLWVSNEDNSRASAIDVASGRIVASLPVGEEPEGVAASPDGRWVAVTSETTSTLSILDARRGRAARRLFADARPRSVQFSRDSRTLYATAEIGGSLSAWDTRSWKLLWRLTLPGPVKAVGLAVSADGRRVFVTTSHANGVDVVDTATHAVAANIPVGKRPWGVVLSSDGRFLYTANGVSGDVSIVDVTAGRVVATVKAGDGPWGVAVAR